MKDFIAIMFVYVIAFVLCLLMTVLLSPVFALFQ